MSNTLTISKTSPPEPSLNYAALREEGLRHIEALGSALWTDYNVHDPGITILELLCYAITDLGYRTGMPVETLISQPGNNDENIKKQFFTAKEILTTQPVSELDLRKLLIDIDGIKNVWLFKSRQTLYFDKKDTRVVGSLPPQNHSSSNFVLNGLYEIKIELDEEPVPKDCNNAATPTEEEITAAAERINQLKQQVIKTFHRHRPLCEDLVSVSVVEEQKIRFCFDMQITAQADANDIYPKALHIISSYLSPSIRQYPLSEMLQSKKENGEPYTVDEIFNGPVLNHGFFKDEELIRSGLRKNIYASDIINLLMDIPGVMAVNNFLMNYCDTVNTERHQWCLPVSEGKKPVLCYCKSAIGFYKDVIPVKAPKQQAINKWFEMLQAEQAGALTITYDDYAYTKGAWQQNDAYTSISQNLPQCYGVGNAGLSASVPFTRTVKSFQLKGFLLFFDQVLANYIAQLNGLKNLFRLKDTTLANPETGTYFYQRINTFKDVEKLIDNYDSIDAPDGVLDTLVKEYDNKPDRKNRLFDHLLSRFAENFTEYVLQMYSLQGQQSAENVIAAKSLLLKEYPQINAGRSLGFDYYNDTDENDNAVTFWDTENVSGMEHRLSRLLGIANYKRRNLSDAVTDGSDEGMFVVEHILLRPDIAALKEQEGLFLEQNFIPVCKDGDCDDCSVDPYSFKISVILPAESERFKDFDFRTYIEKTIRLETPAHIYPRICWWSREDLAIFEPIYKAWLDIKQTHAEGTPEGIQALQDLIKILNERKSIYPPGVLSDCDNPADNPVVLDKTNLGNLKT